MLCYIYQVCSTILAAINVLLKQIYVPSLEMHNILLSFLTQIFAFFLSTHLPLLRTALMVKPKFTMLKQPLSLHKTYVS